MSNCRCTDVACKTTGTLIAVISGIVTGILFFFGVLRGGVLPFIVTLNFSAVAFFGIVALELFAKKELLKKCLCRLGKTLLTGAIGAFLASLAALFSCLSACSVWAAILVGLVAFFLVLLISAVICLINCAKDCD